MKNNILDLIDFEKVDILLEGFNQSTGFVTAILDLDGKVLSKSGWRQMCTHFHRINPETSSRCTVSDTILANKMAEGEKYHFYKCLNGLVDVAVPIVINDEHVANLFSGQFFFEEPDLVFFKTQAKKYGFDENKYLESLEKVPVVSTEKVKTAMDFLLNMTLLISDLAFQKLEQMELNRTIRESEEKFRSITEKTNDFISITDANGIITYASSASEKLFQFDPEEMCGRNLIEFVDEQEIARALEVFKDSLKENTGNRNIEFSLKRKDGSIFIAELNGSKFQHDLMNGTLVVIRDITERKQVEKALRTNEAKFRAVAEFSPMAIYASSGSDQKEVYINEAFYKIFGYTIDDVPTVGHWWIKAFPDEKYRQQVINQWVYNIEQADKNNTDVEILECVCTCKNGSEKTIAWVGKTIGDEFWAFGYDLTERKQAEEQIRDKDMQFRKLSSNMSDLIFQFTKRPDGTYYVPISSEGIKNIFGCSPEDVAEDFAPIIRVILPEDAEKVINSIEYSAQHLSDFSCEFRVQLPGKSVQWIYSKSTPEKLADGNITWYGYTANITERKKAEEDILATQAKLSEALEVSNRSRKMLLSVLEDQRRTQQEINTLNAELEHRVDERTTQLEVANKELEAFSYSVSHDLRAPLRHINGFISLFLENKKTAITEEELGYLNIVSNSAKEMGDLIDALLSFSRLNRAEIQKTPINSSSMISQLQEMFTEEFKSRKIEIQMNELPLFNGDCQLIKQVWMNLLSNAIKYTSKKEVAKIEIGSFEHDSETVFFIKDNGAGFNMKYGDKLFGVFQRLHKPRDFEGIGIGLANVNRIITRHGGRCWAEGELGQGATFYFSIPKSKE